MSKRSRLFTVLTLLLIAGSLAITQESPDLSESEELPGEAEASDNGLEDEPDPPVPLPDWLVPARWFRSNSGAMQLEEIPSRLTAIRNEYALVIDFIERDELPGLLLPYYNDHYIEIRVLYRNAVEQRKQWIFRDEQGLYRLIAVFTEAADEDDAVSNEDTVPEGEAAPDEGTVDSEIAASDDTGYRNAPLRKYSGFIEIYGEKLLLEKELNFSESGDIRETVYTYNRGTLIRTVSLHKTSAENSEDVRKIYTDNYRYNRSGSLRLVERTFHERLDDEKTGIRFPHRVLDAVADSMFITDKVFLTSEFYDGFSVEPEQKMIFTTDERNRILTQSLMDSDGEPLWIVTNTWSGERITSSLKVEGEEQRLNEYEYDADGNRIVERNIHNGVLQRQVLTDGKTDTEELFMNGVVVLRAIWEDGRKVSEQRVRPGGGTRQTPRPAIDALAEEPASEEPHESDTAAQGED